MRNSFFTLSFFLFVSLVYGQIGNEFDKLVDKTYMAIYENPDKAIHLAQHITLNKQEITKKNFMTLLLGQAYLLKGDYGLSSDQVFKENLFQTPAIQNYCLAKQYYELGFKEKAIDLLKNKAIDFNQLKNQNMVLILQYLYYSLALKLNLNWKNDFISKTYNPSKFVNVELFNFIHLQMAYDEMESKSSQQNIEETIQKLDSIDKSLSRFGAINTKPIYYKTKILMAQAKIDFNQKNNHKAINLLEEALALSAFSNFFMDKLTIYDELASNYLVINDVSNFKRVRLLGQDMSGILEVNKKEATNLLVNSLKESQENVLQRNIDKEDNRNWYFGILGFFIVFIVLYLWRNKIESNKSLRKQMAFYQSQKKYYEKIQQKADKIGLDTNAKNQENKAKIAEINNDELENTSNKYTKKSLIILKETEEQLLQKLEEFEHSDRYLSREMSLAVLAGQLETNTKYLSEVINSYKNKNFNLYINELRVNYIAMKLKTEPAYLNYKVSYLAEVCGFSSHSAFTTVFKNVTGISPNTYIRQITKFEKHEV